MGTAVIFTGGPPPADSVTSARMSRMSRSLEGYQPDLVVAADSGLALATATGWSPDVVIGDMDSVDPAALVAAETSGARIVRHPVDKDATDLELALDAVAAAGASDVLVLGSTGGRLDHLLGGALVLASPRYSDMRIHGYLGGTRVLPVHDRRSFRAEIGAVVSLVAVNGPATGVTTTGLRWVLQDARLDPGSSLGMSNELLEDAAEVHIDAGTLIVIVPDHTEVAP